MCVSQYVLLQAIIVIITFHYRYYYVTNGVGGHRDSPSPIARTSQGEINASGDICPGRGGQGRKNVGPPDEDGRTQTPAADSTDDPSPASASRIGDRRAQKRVRLPLVRGRATAVGLFVFSLCRAPPRSSRGKPTHRANGMQSRAKKNYIVILKNRTNRPVTTEIYVYILSDGRVGPGWARGGVLERRSP